MIKFFRKKRQNLLSEGKTGKYFKYAIGEILLVMIGILLALQVNNWNEARKVRINFEFGLKQIYTQIKVNYFDLLTSRERVNFQLSYIDSLMNYPNILKPEYLPGIIQLLDYKGLTSDINQRESFEPFLKLNINDEVQNELAKSLGKNFLNAKYDISNQSFNFKNTEFTVNLFDHLSAYNIPLRFIAQAQAFREFIKAPSNFYNESHLNSAMSLLKNPSFQADLKTIQYMKQEYVRDLFGLENVYTSTLGFLDKNYPNSMDNIDNIEIIGSGIPSSNWAFGIPMTRISDGIFEIELELIPGEIKFRTDQNYTYDWGGSQRDVNQLAFKGTNIPVIQGHYKIIININDMTYSISLID